LGKLCLAAVAALSGALILSSGTPAHAAAPVVTSTGLTEGQLVGRLATIKPTFSGSDLYAVRILVNGISNATYHGAELTGSYRAILGAVPTDTDVDITVQVYDAPGSYGQATTRVHVDNVMPTAGYSPGSSVPVHGETTFTFSSVSDDVVEIVVNAGGGRVIGRATGAPWAVTGDVGTGVSTITVTDRAGNVTTYYPTFNVDNRGPWISILSAIQGQSGAGGRPFVAPDGRIDVSLTDPAGVARWEWSIDGVPAGSGTSVYRHFGADGDITTAKVDAWDRFGTQSTSTQEFVVDGKAPAVTWVSPAAGALIRGDQVWSTIQFNDQAGFSGNFTGGSISGPGYFTQTTGRVVASRSFWNDGRHTLAWNFTDRLGNRGTVSRTVIMDSTAPALAVTKAPKNRAKVKGTVKITASAKDVNGVARVQLLINGKVVATDYKAGYAFSINTRKHGKKIKVQLRAYDRAGNVRVTTTRTWYR
jgi:hypothetical protein